MTCPMSSAAGQSVIRNLVPRETGSGINRLEVVETLKAIGKRDKIRSLCLKEKKKRWYFVPTDGDKRGKVKE